MIGVAHTSSAVYLQTGAASRTRDTLTLTMLTLSMLTLTAAYLQCLDGRPL
jgi:hypothetical protein